MVLVVARGGGERETGLWRSASATEDLISSLEVGGGGPGAVTDPLIGVFTSKNAEHAFGSGPALPHQFSHHNRSGLPHFTLDFREALLALGDQAAT